MAFTTKDQVTNIGASPGNRGDLTLYYAKDMDIVRGQEGFSKFEFVNVRFERKDGVHEEYNITVLGGFDKEGNLLDKLALGWPPYYHTEDDKYQPGNFLPAG